MAVIGAAIKPPMCRSIPMVLAVICRLHGIISLVSFSMAGKRQGKPGPAGIAERLTKRRT